MKASVFGWPGRAEVVMPGDGVTSERQLAGVPCKGKAGT